MGIPRIYNPKTKKWEAAVSSANIPIVDMSNSYTCSDVESAFQEVAAWNTKNSTSIDRMEKTLETHEEKIEYLVINGGGSGGNGGAVVPTITSTIEADTIELESGQSLRIPIFFSSANLGEGLAFVSFDDIQYDTYTVKQGNNTLDIGPMKKLQTKVSVYVKDRAGLLSNIITWKVINGGIELTLDFDYTVDFAFGVDIIMPYTINTPYTTPVILNITVDYETITVPCNNGYNDYTFTNLGVGIHKVTVQATDQKYFSRKYEFSLVVIDSDSLYLTTTFDNGEYLYGAPISINYRISNGDDTKFDLNLYLDGEVVKTQNISRGSYYWIINDRLDLGDHTYKIELLNGDDTRTIEGTFKVIQGTYTPLNINESGLIYRLDPSSRTNDDSDKDMPMYNGIKATLHNFNYSSNGWVDGELVCSGGAYVDIDFYPWMTNETTANGSTIEIYYKSYDIGRDALVFDYSDVDTKKGAKIGLNSCTISSISNTGESFTTTDKYIKVSFVLDRKQKFAKIFIDGICSRAFKLSDSGTGVNTIYEDFAHAQKLYLNYDKANDITGYCAIKDVLVYRRALTDEEIIKNGLSYEKNLIEQQMKYEFEFNNTSLPQIRMYGDTSTMTLENQVQMRIKYTSTNSEKYGQSFDLPYCLVNWQGTSSIGYVLKNFQVRLLDQNMQPYYYTPFPNGILEYIFTFKADYMESSHGRNVGTARLCNDCVFTTKNPAQLQNSKVRNSIDGFPCVLYINDELQGIYNFNADRYSNNVFGYTDPDKTLVYEISANSDTTAGAFNAWRSESTVKVPMKYYKDSIDADNTFNKIGGFCTQYIKVTPGSSITFNPGSLWSTSSIELLLYNDMDNIRQGVIKKGNTATIGSSINYIRVNCWETTYTTLPSDTININGKDYELSQTVTALDIETEYIQSISIGTSKSELDYYKSDFTCIYPPTRAAGNDNFSEIKRLVEWVDGASDEDFRDNLEQYFNKEYLLRYFIIVQIFALVDSLGKNMKLATWDGNIWYPQVYDADTSCGLDNSGFLKFDSDVEIGDKNVFNTTSSKLWQKVMLLLMDDIKAEYAKLRNTTLTLNNIIKYIVEDQIEMIPASFYNNDMQTKYLNFGTTYLYALHGNSKNQLIKFITDRLLYIDTLYDYTVTTTDFVTIRSSKLGLVYLDIQTFIPMYLRVKWRNEADGSGLQKLRVSKGQTVRFSFEQPTETDQEIMIYGGKYLKSIGDLSNLAPTTISIGNAPKLTDLTCHSENLINTDLGNCVNLTHVDLSDCTQLGTGVGSNPILDISKCMNLEYIDIRNTTLTSVQLNPLGSNVREIYFPSTIEAITLINCPQLSKVYITENSTCKSLKIINCPNVESFGDRIWLSSENRYYWSACKWLTGIADIYIDNSLCNLEEFDMNRCVRLKNLTLKNIPNITTVKLGVNTIREKTFVQMNNTLLEECNDVTLNIFNCPKAENFIITCAQRYSSSEPFYGYNDQKTGITTYLYGSPFKLFDSFDVNNLNLTNTSFKSIKLLCTCNINNLILPDTVNEFICDSLFDIYNRNDSFNYYHYSDYNFNNQPMVTDLVGFWKMNTRDEGLYGNSTDYYKPISSSSGSVIYNIWCEKFSSKPENLYIWDLKGLVFNNFFINFLNIRIVSMAQFGYATKNFSDYNIQIINADISPINHPLCISLYSFNTTIPIIGKLDYSNYIGYSLFKALCYLTDDCIITVPENLDNITYFDKILYYTNITQQLGWDFVEKIFKISNTFDIIYNTTLKEQVDESESIDIISNLSSIPWGLTIGTKTNLKYINILNLPNYNNSFTNYFKSNTFIKKINVVELPKVTSLSQTFRESSLEEIGDIHILGSAVNGSNTEPVLNTTFSSCKSLIKVGNIIVDTAEILVYYSCNSFLNCEKLESIGEINYTSGNYGNMFQNCYKLKTIAKLPDMSLSTPGFQFCGSLEKLDFTDTNIYNPTEENERKHSLSFYNASIGELIGLPTIPNDMKDCSGRFQSCYIGSGELPKFTENSSCTNITSMFNSYKGNLQIPSPFVVPNGVTSIGYLFYKANGIPEDFVLDCSNVDYLLNTQELIIKNPKNFTFKLPKYLYNNTYGNEDFTTNNNKNYNWFYGADSNSLRKFELNYDSYIGSKLPFSNTLFNQVPINGGIDNSDGLVFNGIDFNLFAKNPISSNKVSIKDFTVHGKCDNKDINLSSWRMNFEKYSKFIDEALDITSGADRCYGVSVSKITDSSYYETDYFTVKSNTNYTLTLLNTGVYHSIIYYNENKEQISSQGWAGGNPNIHEITTPEGTVYCKVNRFVEGATITMIETGGTINTLTLSKYCNYDQSIILTDDQKNQLTLQATPKGWNITFV